MIRVTGLTEELQVTKRMYQCCLDTEQILKKEKQKANEDIWLVKAAYSQEMENLLKIQVNTIYILIMNKVNLRVFAISLSGKNTIFF